MIARLATSAGRQLLSWRFDPPVRHWRRRVWDGDRAESHPLLGRAYQEERSAVTDLLSAAVAGFSSTAQSFATISGNERITVILGIDVACGTGRYSRALLGAGADHVVCVDVNPASLIELLHRADDPSRVSLVEGDLFRPQTRQRIERAVAAAVASAGGDPGTRVHRVVVCCDAIHHLGSPADVLATLRDLAGPTGAVVGDIWTLDRFQEFQRLRRGRVEAALGAVRFAAAAAVNTVARRPLLHAARSLLLPSSKIVEAVTDTFGADRVDTSAGTYWVRFRARS